QSQENLKKFGEQVPLGRPGQPAEVAPLYVLLASQESSYITGGLFPITGGKLM
ncbi:SDR family oxidoreductase, partial [uncultured Deinococcus sp.]